MSKINREKKIRNQNNFDFELFFFNNNNYYFHVRHRDDHHDQISIKVPVPTVMIPKLMKITHTLDHMLTVYERRLTRWCWDRSGARDVCPQLWLRRRWYVLVGRRRKLYYRQSTRAVGTADAGAAVAAAATAASRRRKGGSYVLEGSWSKYFRKIIPIKIFPVKMSSVQNISVKNFSETKYLQDKYSRIHNISKTKYLRKKKLELNIYKKFISSQNIFYIKISERKNNILFYTINLVSVTKTK